MTFKALDAMVEFFLSLSRRCNRGMQMNLFCGFKLEYLGTESLFNLVCLFLEQLRLRNVA